MLSRHETRYHVQSFPSADAQALLDNGDAVSTKSLLLMKKEEMLTEMIKLEASQQLHTNSSIDPATQYFSLVGVVLRGGGLPSIH